MPFDLKCNLKCNLKCVFSCILWNAEVIAFHRCVWNAHWNLGIPIWHFLKPPFAFQDIFWNAHWSARISWNADAFHWESSWKCNAFQEYPWNAPFISERTLETFHSALTRSVAHTNARQAFSQSELENWVWWRILQSEAVVEVCMEN